MLKNLKYIFYVFLLSSLIGGFYYVSSLKDNIKDLHRDKEVLEEVVEEQKSVIEKQLQDLQKIQKINQKLIKIKQDQNNKINQLKKKFEVNSGGKERDLGKISRKKPGLVENIINDAASKNSRCFEILTGSELKEGESYEDCM